MGLRIIKKKDGSHRPTWYARFTRDGRKIDVNLKVPIHGRIPRDAHGHITLKSCGDAAFEASRREALERLQKGTVPAAAQKGTVPNRMGTVPVSRPQKGTAPVSRPKTITRAPKTVTTSPPPLTRDQIDALLNPAHEDAFFHPLIVTALCTGLRLGAVCQLKWTQVNRVEGTLSVPASTGTERLTLPILAPLHAILEVCDAKRDKADTFVFPEAARRYTFTTQTGVNSLRGYIINGLKPILGALFTPPPIPPADTPPLTMDDVLARIRTAAFIPGKTKRLILTYQQFTLGKSYSQISALTGKNKGQCSADLKTIESLIGRSLRPGATAKSKFAATGQTLAQLTARTRRTETTGKRHASLYGWRSLRLAFYTLAAEAGIDSDKIERIIGSANLKKMREWNRQTVASTHSVTPPQPDHIAARVLSLLRAVIPPSQAERVNAILHAAGVDSDIDPKRALALVGSAVSKARSRITAVLKSAGL